MRLGFVAFALAALIGASIASAECLKANKNGEVAEGILSLGTFEDANDGPEKAYILILPAPVCVSERRGRHGQSVERRDDPRLFFRRGRRAKPEAARRQEGQSERPCLRCDHRASSRANRYGEQRDRGRLTSLDQGRSVSLGIRCPRRVSNIESFASLSLLRAPSLVRHRGSRFSRSNRLAPWPSDLASPGAGWPSPVPCP